MKLKEFYEIMNYLRDKGNTQQALDLLTITEILALYKKEVTK